MKKNWFCNWKPSGKESCFTGRWILLNISKLCFPAELTSSMRALTCKVWKGGVKLIVLMLRRWMQAPRTILLWHGIAPLLTHLVEVGRSQDHCSSSSSARVECFALWQGCQLHLQVTLFVKVGGRERWASACPICPISSQQVPVFSLIFPIHIYLFFLSAHPTHSGPSPRNTSLS